MDEKIRVAVCDDAAYICESFREGLEDAEGIVLTGEAHSAAECLEMIRACKPDILLLDISMETDTAGIDIIPELKDSRPELKIIMLTCFEYEDYVFQAFVNGANDYISKGQSIDKIITVIRNAYANNTMLRYEISQKLIHKAQEVKDYQQSMLYVIEIMSKLSTGEFEILKALCEGKNYKQIAKERFVEENSVRGVASRILKKFNANKMKALVADIRELNVFKLFEK